MSNYNKEYIRKYAGGMAGQVDSFARIRSWGDKGNAITHDGDVVERMEYIFAGEGYGLVKCIPYELHFIFEDPRSKSSHPNPIKGRWAYMCTCGSMAGIVSYNEMKTMMDVQGTEKGYVLACIHHTMSKHEHPGRAGKHADGSSE